MSSRFSRFSQSGFSLIESIVAVAVLLIGALAILELTQSQNIAIANLKQKLSSVELAREIGTSLSQVPSCTFNLSSNGTQTVDATLIPNISTGTSLATSLLNPNSIFESAAVTARRIVQAAQLVPNSFGLTVQTIRVVNWRARSANSFVADLEIMISPPSGTSPLAPIALRSLNFLTNPASPVSAKVITACSINSLASAGGVSFVGGASVPLTSAAPYFTYNAPAGTTPLQITLYTELMALSNTNCILQAQWTDSLAVVVQPWETIAASQPRAGPDGGAALHTGHSVTVPFVGGARRIEFRHVGPYVGGPNIRVITYSESI